MKSLSFEHNLSKEEVCLFLKPAKIFRYLLFSMTQKKQRNILDVQSQLHAPMIITFQSHISP